jgi:hypothetical protein
MGCTSFTKSTAKAEEARARVKREGRDARRGLFMGFRGVAGETTGSDSIFFTKPDIWESYPVSCFEAVKRLDWVFAATKLLDASILPRSEATRGR